MKNSWLGTILKDTMFSEKVTKKKKKNQYNGSDPI